MPMVKATALKHPPQHLSGPSPQVCRCLILGLNSLLAFLSSLLGIGCLSLAICKMVRVLDIQACRAKI